MKNRVLKIILTMLLAANYSHSIADVSAKVIAYGCYTCHGEKLAALKVSGNLTAVELTQTLLAFKTNSKSATIMDRITKGYSDAELAAVASYLSELN